MNKILPSGFIEDKITPEHFNMGADQLGAEMLQPNGDWTSFLPSPEKQRKRTETYACVSFGTLNALEILHKRLYGVEVNYSDRYLAIVSETTSRGNSAHKVAEAVRKYGCIPEEALPFTEAITSQRQYLSPDPMPQKYIDMGTEWLKRYSMGHDWLWTWKGISVKEKQKRIREALKYSPLGLSVLAWRYQNGYYVKRRGESDNHWTGGVIVKANPDHYLIYDTYEPHLKKLPLDYDFFYAKRYSLKKKLKERTSMEKETLEKYYKLGFKRPLDEGALSHLQYSDDQVLDALIGSEESELIGKILNWMRGGSLNIFSLFRLAGRYREELAGKLKNK